MRLALLFSGQGGQGPAHWAQVARGAPPPVWQALADCGITNASVNPEKLAKNSLAQPIIFAQQMTLWSQLQADLPRPVCAAGYSLGEMAACCVAGAFDADVGVQLCVARARLMDDAAPGEHGMLAVLGLDEQQVAVLAGDCGLAVAIRNAPRHLVLAGPRAGLGVAAARFAAAGASRVVELAVRTPSHTALLASAAVDFEKRLNLLPDRRLAFPVLSAIDATPARTGRAALKALARQIATPLDWASCLQAVREMQPDAVLEIGPGNALSRLFGELEPGVPARACDDFRSIEGIVKWIDHCA